MVPSDRRTLSVRGPNYYVHAIYKDIAGAALVPVDPTGTIVAYSVPCNTKLNLTFSFRCVNGRSTCVELLTLRA